MLTLRDHFAAAVAPALLNLQLLTGQVKMKMKMDFDPETGAPAGATATQEGKVDYNEIAVEAYMLADALVRVAQSTAGKVPVDDAVTATTV